LASIAIDRVSRSFGSVQAVREVSVTVADGEFFTLLGPSGCGKTTLLRMVAGFADLEGGAIRFGERRIDTLPPHKRNTGMVFQNYAIFPNLTVADNVAYGLRARRVGAPEIAERVGRALRLVQLSGYETRWPHQLSGGQLQRVVLARALVVGPEFLVADEPVSMLDVSIRLGVLNLLRDLKERLNLAILYITHDIASARYFADETLVMYAGRLVEGGESETVTQNPAHPYTQLLIDSAPDPDRLGQLGTPEDQAGGEPPSLIAPPTGCRFHPRCVHAMPKCSTELPPRFELPAQGHWAACWLYEEGAAR
jgi:peptide/nickel transport system ATP-binding protein